MRLYLILAFIFLSENLYSSPGLFCSTKGRHSELRITTNDSVVVDFDFSSKSFIPSYYMCLAFLDSIQQDQELQYSSLISHENDKTQYARLTGPLKRYLHEKCYQSPDCRINFPYNLTTWSGLKSIFGDKSEQQSSNCHIQLSKPRLGINRTKKVIDSKQVQWWHQPQSNLSLELLESIIKHSPEEIVISTMTLSKSEIIFLNQYLLDHPSAHAFVFYAFGLATFETDYPNWIDELNPRLFLMPVFTTPYNHSSYHIKGISWHSPKAQGLIFSSSNFKAYDNKKLIDIGFRTNDSKLAQDFRSQLFHIGRLICEKPQIFDCHLEKRYPQQKEAQNILRNRLAQVCRYLPPPLYLADSQMLTGPLKKDILSFIESAKVSIDIYVHALSDPEVIKALQDKKAKGIQVQIKLGQSIDFNKIKLGTLAENVFIQPDEVHSKIIIIDQKIISISSANLTDSALNNAYENMFFLKYDKIITSSLELPRK